MKHQNGGRARQECRSRRREKSELIGHVVSHLRPESPTSRINSLRTRPILCGQSLAQTRNAGLEGKVAICRPLLFVEASRSQAASMLVGSRLRVGIFCRLGFRSQASCQLITFNDLTNLPTPSVSAQNSPSSMISWSEKCLRNSAKISLEFDPVVHPS